MACACKVNRQIEQIHKYYGSTQRGGSKTTITEDIKLFFKRFFYYFIFIIAAPFFMCYLTYNFVCGNKPISIKKLFKLN